jgi:hypothetical protein
MTTNKETQIIEVKAELDPNLKILAETLKETTSQYKKLMSQLVDAAKAGKITEDQFRLITGSVQKLGAGAKASSEGMTAAEKAMKGWSASMQQLEGSMTTLPIRIEQVKTALEGMRAAGDTSSGTYKANVLALRSLEDQMAKFDAANRGSVSGMKDMRFAAQNAAYQFTDMAVSLKGGQNAAMVMAQQLPQLIAGFGGAKFAAAGLAVTLLAVSFAPLIADIQKWLDGEKRFTDSIKELDKVLKESFQGLQEFNTDSWVRAFNEADESAQRLMKTLLEINKTKAVQELRKQTEEIANINFDIVSAGFFGFIGQMTSGSLALAERFRITNDEAVGLKTAVQQLDLKDAGGVIAFWERWGKVLQQTTNPEMKKQVELLAEYVIKVEAAGRATKEFDKLSGAKIGERMALDVGKATAAYREQTLVLQDRKNLVPFQIAELQSLRAAGKITAEVYQEQYEALTKTKGASKKLGDEFKRLQEEWAKLVGKSDPIKAFVDAVKQAEELRKKVKGSVEDLALVYDGLIKTREASLQKLIDEKTIEDFARLYGVSEDTAKSLINLRKKAGEANETLKVMAQAMQAGDVAFAQQIADSLDLKVLPAAERSASAFRRLKADAAKQADIQIGFEDWLKTSEAISATTAQVIEVGKATGAVVPNVYKIQEAWEKMANDRNGLIKTREEVEAFIATQRSLGQMTDELAEKLRNTFGVNTQTLVESMTIAVGQTLANGVSNFVDVLTESGKTFREWAADLIKEIGKVMIKLAALAAFKTFTKGTAFEGLLGRSLPSGSNVIPFPVSPPPSVSRLSADSGIQPLVRFGTPAAASNTLSGGGSSPVNIVVNNTISDTAKVEVAETQKPDGTKEISILIRKEVRAMLGDGSTDSLMRSNYGLRRSAA